MESKIQIYKWLRYIYLYYFSKKPLGIVDYCLFVNISYKTSWRISNELHSIKQRKDIYELLFDDFNNEAKNNLVRNKKMLINTEDRSQNEINTMSIVNVSEDIFSKVLKEIITQEKDVYKR